MKTNMKNSYFIDINEIFLSSLFSKENFQMIPHLKGDLHKIEEIDLNVLKQSANRYINIYVYSHTRY